MATAVQPSITPKPADERTRLALASAVGAAFVLAGIAAAIYLPLLLWKQAFPVDRAGSSVALASRLFLTQVVAAAGVIWVGTRVVGANPPRGLRGGIFLTVSAVIAVLFVARAVGVHAEDYGSTGMIATLAVTGLLAAAAYYGLVSPRGEAAMVGIEDQGWLHTFQYKRTQGRRMRLFTLGGILLIGGSGVVTLVVHEYLGRGDWVVRVPFTDSTITLLSDIGLTVPVLLAVLTAWVAWRAVNVPGFADFLIATDAEMNKVSWSTRKRLVQDTIVVLVTVVLMTLFLFLVDWFWGTLLSWRPIGVLPDASQNKAQVIDPTQGRKVDW